MDQIKFSILLRTIVLQCFIMRNVFSIQKREWIDTPSAKLTEGDVSCFSENMEMWIHSARIEGLGVWLSGALRMRVNLASLDHLNLQLSACGFSLHKDPNENFIFGVSYTGCLVQQQHGYHILTLNLVRRINRFGGRPHSFIMKCPVVSMLPCREQIQCDPEFIQVTRQVPYDNWDNELHWSLSLSNHLIVALEDASLIQMNANMSGPDITVQGRRKEVLSPVKVMENEGEFLALKLVSGQYAYSMEATCPKVTTSTAEETVLHIFKRRMGLTKRGSDVNEALTVSNVSVPQTDNFTVHETSEFVTLIIPTAQILQTKACADHKQLLQPFYRVDVVLTFKETNHKMHWTMENTLPCTVRPAASHIASSPGLNTSALSMLNFKHQNFTTEQPSLERSTVPPFKEFSTIRSHHTETEALSSGFDGDTISAINATETNFLDFRNETADSSSAEPGFLESSARAEPSETSFLTTDPPEQEYQQFNTTIGSKDQQKQRRLKWIWRD
ncbi:ciliated left-right organizer protein containing ZP-N domains homolog [Chaetodon auriga]|uniref:ciliated left-right organizer protein containing ZP-N domains homolog n=1 Tax=Chaetodon auriga TaxID=39042 RepID=UPI004032F3FB